MNTKQIREITKITPKALRIYEAYGLIFPKREKNGYRNYSDEDIIKLREITLLKELGFSLKEIKILTDKNKIAKGPDDTKFTKSLYFQMKAIEKRMEELENINQAIKDSINDLLNSNDMGSELYFQNVNKSLEKSKKQRKHWTDKWGFDNWADSYDEFTTIVKGELKIFEDYVEIIEKVRQTVMKNSPSSILDLGCGTGSLCGELSKNLEIVGMDQSIEMLLIARGKYPTMTLRLGNFLDKPYCSNHFDVVVSTYAFHHLQLEEKLTAIQYMCEYLKENGRIVIADLMFLNNEERDKCRRNFIVQDRADLWAIIEDEYYSMIEDIQSFTVSKGLIFIMNIWPILPG